MTGRPSNQTLRGTILFASFVGCAGSVHAGPVTWEFEGEMTYFYDAANLFDGSVEVGTPYSGVFTFDSETPDTSSSSSRGTFEGAVTSIMIELGGHTVLGPTAGFNRITITNNSSITGLDVFSISTSVMLGAEELGFGLQLRDSDGMTFDAKTLPLVPPGFDLLDATGASITLSTENQLLFVRGSITSVVPEPGTLTLLAVCGCLTCIQHQCLTNQEETT